MAGSKILWALFVLPGIAVVSGLIGFVGKQAVLGAGLFLSVWPDFC